LVGEIFVGEADLTIRVQPSADGDDDEVAEITRRLRGELLDLDVESADPIAGPSAPGGAKGLETLLGWIAVRLGKEALPPVVRAVVNFATRSGHKIEITIDGDTLKVNGVTSAQQERIIDEFFDRHRVGT
jgi:hypothetical protein